MNSNYMTYKIPIRIKFLSFIVFVNKITVCTVSELFISMKNLKSTPDFQHVT